MVTAKPASSTWSAKWFTVSFRTRAASPSVRFWYEHYYKGAKDEMSWATAQNIDLILEQDQFDSTPNKLNPPLFVVPRVGCFGRTAPYDRCATAAAAPSFIARTHTRRRSSARPRPLSSPR